MQIINILHNIRSDTYSMLLAFCCRCDYVIFNFCFRYDSRVKAMEVDERPTEQYSDIGGLDSQIQEV